MSIIREGVSDDYRAKELDKLAHHPPTTPAVVAAHEAVRNQCIALSNWAMDTIPYGPGLTESLDAIRHACMALNGAIATTQLVGDVERMLLTARRERDDTGGHASA
jgi:hypothetical protein